MNLLAIDTLFGRNDSTTLKKLAGALRFVIENRFVCTNAVDDRLRAIRLLLSSVPKRLGEE